jgi:hypothetical protein
MPTLSKADAVAPIPGDGAASPMHPVRTRCGLGRWLARGNGGSVNPRRGHGLVPEDT